MPQDTDDQAKLATMIADLDGYIERRAGERAQRLARPLIERADKAADDGYAEARRYKDLADELKRQVETLQKQNDRLRTGAR